MSEWQDIEKCPKDGRWFLICRKGEEGSFEVGRFNPYMSPTYVEEADGRFRREMKPGYEWDGFNNMHRATHWHPLPEPPKDT